MSRRNARETALKILFQIDVGKMGVEEALAAGREVFELAESSSDFTEGLVWGAFNHLQELDGLIEEFSIDWPMARMASIDRNILRLAVYEILYVGDIPASVSVNEAVELAKRYGNADSGKFVNGILGNVVRSRAKDKV
ncbi:MAG: transcription antitermination factor NusB [Firmicutes bacterium]|nr:transcription antitermination factor NusB [Bacillota bacterium]